MKHIEVEQKFHLQNHAELRDRLKKADAKRLRIEHQVDTYYNAPHRDFLAEPNVSEWLRLREEKDTSSITYKRWLPLKAKVKTHCDEFESELSDGEAMRKLLEALYFTELIVVDKRREEWQLTDVIIALDTIKDLGSFVEFEYHGDAKTVNEAHRRIEQCIAKLDAKLGDTHTGYPHQLIAKRRPNNNSPYAKPPASLSA
ncbi:MAG TPA: class IV adenylate cyclase [Candidatus Saccharimonadales bacterium]|jgi:adenylate cyclase class 2